ncbi:MAG: hypothetical protein ACRCT8_16245, partial [Lacipirellulaceae bacterium]
ETVGRPVVVGLPAGGLRPPYAALPLGVVDGGGGRVWGAWPRGVGMLEPGRTPAEGRWRLFHSRRWLPPGEVTGIERLANDEAGVLVTTTEGAGRIVARTTTLRAKAKAANAALRRWHLREGLVGEGLLKVPGDPREGVSVPSNDNDGLWTAMYVAAEAFRFAETGAADARANALESLDALLRLERVTGVPGFLARSFVRVIDDPDPATRYGGEWHKTADGLLWWKGDTSSDELVGHYFAWYVCFELLNDSAAREAIAGVVRRVTDKILADGLRYHDLDGERTTWGFWDPATLNDDPERIEERGTNSIEILSFLAVATHVTGDPKYAREAERLVTEHAYAQNTILQKVLSPPDAINHSDDELAFLAYYPLLDLERDPRRRAAYIDSLRRSYAVERPERSPLFAAVNWAGIEGKDAAAELADERRVATEWFRDTPIDFTCWTVVNSDRQDVGRVVVSRDGRKRSLDVVLPPSERRVMKWNGDPYEVDGGADGALRDDGTFYLLPLWMALHEGLLE